AQGSGEDVNESSASAVRYHVAELTRRCSCACAMGAKKRISAAFMPGRVRRIASRVHAPSASGSAIAIVHAGAGTSHRIAIASAPEETWKSARRWLVGRKLG